MILDHHRRIESHTLDAGQLSNINIKEHVIKNMNLTSSHLAIDNLLDEQYEEAVGFPAAGTRSRLAAKYAF